LLRNAWKNRFAWQKAWVESHKALRMETNMVCRLNAWNGWRRSWCGLGAGVIVSASLLASGCGRSDSGRQGGETWEAIAVSPPAVLPAIEGQSMLTAEAANGGACGELPPAASPSMAIRPLYEPHPSPVVAAAPVSSRTSRTAAAAATENGEAVESVAADDVHAFTVAHPPAAVENREGVAPVTGRVSGLTAARAMSQVRQGYDLAQRGAHFSARAELVQSLRTIAQGFDTDNATDVHSKALEAGLLALEELEDFTPRSRKASSGLDVLVIVRSHRTQCINERMARSMNRDQARDRYIDYAVGQLVLAVGTEQIASDSLYGLAKIYSFLKTQNTRHNLGAEAKSDAFYQATLLVKPNHALAANDLGVLRANAGRYEEARELLSVSLASGAQPAVWHNLSVVLAQLGDVQGAERARQSVKAASESAVAQDPQVAQWMQSIAWTDPTNFNNVNRGAPQVDRQPAVQQPRQAPQAAAQQNSVQRTASGPRVTPKATPDRPSVRTVQKPTSTWQQ
jgi:tetratricopeptide (TPR) repeat protein